MPECLDKESLRISVVVPVYMECAIINTFHESLCSSIDKLPGIFRVIYINDGSTDGTGEILGQIAKIDRRITIIELSRNFGHQAAITAGLEHADGDVVITMDGDGQHPPELIGEMLNLYFSGYDIVQAKRIEQERGLSFKYLTSSFFYRLISAIGNTPIISGAADFRLVSRQVVDSLNCLPEYHRFIRGMIPWVGYKTVILPFQPNQRIGGKTKYTFGKMLKLAEDAIFSFSLFPLRITAILGLVFLCLSFFEVSYVISYWVQGKQNLLVPGWSSLMFMILLNSAFVLISLGTLGLYIGYVFQEVKRRPVYIIRSVQQGKEEQGVKLDVLVSDVRK